jgi:SPP1 family predicted phage head-tail adaptor
MTAPGAGSLDRSVDIMRASVSDDGISRNLGAYAKIAERRARKLDISDGERLRVGQQAQDLTARFLMRWDAVTTTITARDRLVCEGRTYDVVGAKEWGDRRRRYIEITAAARPDL